MSRNIVQYEHHGTTVSVISDLKGKHREHCLCFSNCEKFKPGTKKNCKIAQAVFDNCVAFGITTPMYECPEYRVSDNTEPAKVRCPNCSWEGTADRCRTFMCAKSNLLCPECFEATEEI
jgi:hypothetical protein